MQENACSMTGSGTVASRVGSMRNAFGSFANGDDQVTLRLPWRSSSCLPYRPNTGRQRGPVTVRQMTAPPETTSAGPPHGECSSRQYFSEILSAYRYFGSTLGFSGFCAVAHPANAPQSHSSGGAPDSFRLSHDVRCSARGERCILGAGCRADHRALGCDLAGRSLRADGDALLFRRATLYLGRSSDCYCRRYTVGCCVRPMSLAHQASNHAVQRTPKAFASRL